MPAPVFSRSCFTWSALIATVVMFLSLMKNGKWKLENAISIFHSPFSNERCEPAWPASR
jgi:hypothetical protein